MYDSVGAIIEPGRNLRDAMWSDQKVTHGNKGTLTKSWLNKRDGSIRVTHYHRDGTDDHGRLSVDFNVPTVVGLSGRENVSDDDRDAALSRVNSWLHERLGALPDVRTWQAQRIDYAWNFALGAAMPVYLLALQTVNGSHGLSRMTFPATGVTWRTRGKHGRTIMFYDKDAKIGDGHNDGVLRFEVQNRKSACAYMGDKWLTDRSVGAALSAGAALYVLARSWSRLGLDVVSSYQHESSLRVRLRDTFGSSAAPAFYHLDLITRYGMRDAVALHLTSANMYYTWKRKLRAAGFLAPLADVMVAGAALDALHLPCVDVIARCEQNLENFQPGALSFIQKNSWEKLAHILGIRSTAEPSEYLLGFYDGR